MGKTERKVMRNILGKEKGAFLGTGMAEMEAFAGRRCPQGSVDPRQWEKGRKNSSLHSGLVHGFGFTTQYEEWREKSISSGNEGGVLGGGD